jgi:hypothetical protein
MNLAAGIGAEAGAIGAGATGTPPGAAQGLQAAGGGAISSGGDVGAGDGTQPGGGWKDVLAAMGVEPPATGAAADIKNATRGSGTSGKVPRSFGPAAAEEASAAEAASLQRAKSGTKPPRALLLRAGGSATRAMGQKPEAQTGAHRETTRAADTGAKKINPSAIADGATNVAAAGNAALPAPPPAVPSRARVNQEGAIDARHKARIPADAGRAGGHEPLQTQPVLEPGSNIAINKGTESTTAETGETDAPAATASPVRFPAADAKEPVAAAIGESAEGRNAASPGSAAAVHVSDPSDSSLRTPARIADPGLETLGRRSAIPGSPGAHAAAANGLPGEGARKWANAERAAEGKNVEPLGTSSLNAPPLRETGGLSGAAEKQMGTSHAAGGGESDPFLALDAERTPPSTWIHAGTHHAEAGYLDPALGWVGVRADAAAGGVHAALVPASGEAAQLLGGHLPALNSYLAEHHGSTATVTMMAPHDGGSGAGRGNDSPQQHQSARGQDPLGTAAREAAVSVSRNASLGGVQDASAVPMVSGGGRYISVMA